MNLNTQSNIKKRRSRRGGRSLSISHHDKTNSNSVESRSQPPVELPVSNSKYLEDPTDSDLDPDDVDKNNKKKRVEVRHLFEMESSGGTCMDCNIFVSTSQRSDANLRTHLANHHGMNQVLLPSQQKRKENKTEYRETMPIEEKRKIDDELIECIIKDSHSFNDFEKPGMRKFLNVVLPNYVPCCRKTITKNLKNR